MITTYKLICARVTKKAKIKAFDSPRNEALVVLDYWSNNIKEYVHIRIPDNINLSDKYTTQNVKNSIHTTAKHVNSMVQGMAGI